MYVADVKQVAVINLAKGTVEKRISVKGAELLNDITVDEKGIVYVSDSKTGKVHKIQKDAATEYLSGFTGVNGLRAYKKDLYVATSKDVFKVDAAKKQTSIGTIEQGGDGIEPIGNGDWVGSAWSGYIYYLYADGRKDLMLDTHEEKINTADIGYDPKRRIVYVPTFFKKSVVAYQLK
jgi:DNA-binding beta-propeller fold protein YncE